MSTKEGWLVGLAATAFLDAAAVVFLVADMDGGWW